MTTRQSFSNEEDCFVPRNDVKVKHFDVAIIGAGPAGIMAAIWVGKSGKNTVLLEKNDIIGRKILATGNGRCNLTNANITINRYHGTDTSFAEPILASFSEHATVKFFESLGVLIKEEDRGRIFPRTNQASTVVEALKAELGKMGVTIITNFTVKNLTPPSLSSLVASQGPNPKLDSWPPTRNDNHWCICAENGQTVTADKLILTTGGKAAHQFGSSGDGLFWAKNWGHTIVPIHAALVPLETKEEFVKEIMGIKLVVNASLVVNGKTIESRKGDLLFTHFGISGPAAMGLAGLASQALADGKEVVVSIDMLPDVTSDDLDATITRQIGEDGKKAIKTILAGLIPKNLIPRILASSGIKDDMKAAEISKSQRKAIIDALKEFRLTVAKVRPLKEAQVTAGGIATVEVTSDLESKIIPGLYFAGEILDVDGDSGGFNLQWAWSSGKVAGESAAKDKKEK